MTGTNFLKLLESKEDEAGNIDYTAFSDHIKIKEMNEKHAFIHSLGGKPCVLGPLYDETLNKEVIEFTAPNDIKMRYINNNVYIETAQGPKTISLGKFWLEHTDRRTYMTVVFDPKRNKEFIPNPQKPKEVIYNMWEGLSLEPKKGSWKRMRKHIWAILCNKKKERFKYVMRWLAWTMQNVGDRAEVALVMKGKQGAGKGLLFSQFEKVFGPHYMNIASGDHLTGKFNGHLRKTVFLFADEAYDPKDRDSEGKLKQLITEPTIPIESKFKDTVIAKNRLHIVMATNNARVIIAGEDSRRFFINEVDNRWAKGQGKTDEQRNAYFTPIWKEMDNGGREAMVYDLQRINLGDWHPRANIPETEEMQNQRRLQFTNVNAVLEWFEIGEWPGKFDGHHYIVKSSVLENHMRTKIPSLKDPKMIHWKKVMEVLHALGVTKETKRIKRLTDGVYISMEELAVMRRAWDKAFPAYKGQWDQLEKPSKNSHKDDFAAYDMSRKWIVTKEVF